MNRHISHLVVLALVLAPRAVHGYTMEQLIVDKVSSKPKPFVLEPAAEKAGNVTITVAGATCSGIIAKGKKVTVVPDGNPGANQIVCPDLFKQTAPGTVTASGAWATPQAFPIAIADCNCSIPAPIAGEPAGLPPELSGSTMIYFHLPNGYWSSIAPSDDVIDEKSFSQWDAIIALKGGNLLRVAAPAAPTGGSRRTTRTSALAPQTTQPGRCDPAHAARAGTERILYFEANASGISRRPCGGRTFAVIRPNQQVTVVVSHPVGDQPKIEMAGQIGLYDAPVRDVAQAGRETVQFTTTEATFAPRQPGSANITVTIETGGKTYVSVAEIVVEKTYSGALRLGIGTVFAGARDRSFEARTLPGSGQAEIVTTGGGSLDAELVLGAAAFFDDGGRSYVARESDRFGLYVGIGVLNQAATSLELLKSAHLGLEYELSPQFSIALTFVGRKVTRLADGLHVGQPVMEGDVPTRTGYEVGLGLVFNVSPEFFKLAKTPSSSFFTARSEP